MNKFKVGDILKGNENNGYAITGENSVVRVVRIYPDKEKLLVLVIKPSLPTQEADIGNEFYVSSSAFTLVEKDKPAKKPRASVIPDFTMTELIHMISDKLGIKPQAFKLQPLGLFRLGTQFESFHQGKYVQHDLSEYFIDEEGTMYSRNNDTYFTKYGKRLTKLSDNSISSSGKIVNSFRDKQGLKVTISRERIKKMMRGGYLEDVTLMSLEDEKVEGIGQLVG